MDNLARFLNKVLPVDNGCHEWQSTLHRDGYGKFWLFNKQYAAHRASYLLQVGEIKDDLCVLHKCDNRKCVNPDHLYLGTHKQNVKDKIERCPWWGNMKYPFEMVEKAKKMYLSGMTQQKIADELGIHQTQVSRYIRGTQRSLK